MYVLSEAQFRSGAAAALQHIFVNDNPYGQPFAPHVANRKILFEYWYAMEPPLLDVVVQVASAQGDEGFYVSLLDRPMVETQKQAYHWYIPFADMTAYHSLVGPLPNVVYSPHGLWGIMCSDKHHGLLGGSEAFMRRVEACLPGLDDQVVRFLDAWQYNAHILNADTRWLPKLLEHVYGQETAHELLRRWNS